MIRQFKYWMNGPFLLSTIFISACSADNNRMLSPYSSELKDLLYKSQVGAAPYNGIPPVPLIIGCIEKIGKIPDCDINRVAMLKSWPKAWAGDPSAQMDVARMLATALDGIPEDKLQGCSWLAIARRHQTLEGTAALSETCNNFELTNPDVQKNVAELERELRSVRSIQGSPED